MSEAVASAFSQRFSGPPPNYTPSSSLVTPTFEGSGITTEPTWIPKPSWVTVACTDLLAHNPLPPGLTYDASHYENPSLLVSNDHGDTWFTPPGLTNPIADKPTAYGSPGTNADCHLFADPNADRLIMTWTVVSDPTVLGSGANPNGIWYSVCTDPTLVTWGARQCLFNLNGVDAQTINFQEQESKIVWDHVRGKYLFFTQHQGTPANTLRLRIGGSDPLGTYGSVQVCDVPIPGGELLWHMDIIQEASGRFIMVFCDAHHDSVSGLLERQGWIATSWDGIHWKCAPRPFMKKNSWTVSGVYRPSLQPARSGPGFDVIVARAQNPDSRLGIVRNVPATEVP